MLIPGVVEYVQEPGNRISWRWGDDAAEWCAGGTIAFRAELEQVLTPLVDQGLPPLSAVLFLLGACRDDWPSVRDQLVLPEDVRQGLDRVHALPAESRHAAAYRRTLVQVVFEECRGKLFGRPARSAIRLMSAPLSLPEDADPSTRWRLAMSALRAGLPRIDNAALQLRERTGLDELPQPAEIELLTAEPIQQLLREIADDPELGGLARMVRNLAAIVHLPRALAEPEDLPLGGFSDVANRGPLDRLLLSELAHDDELLTTRIALNEALYLRRETPPRKPPQTRRLLVDVGLRSWGLPRLYGTAVAMTIASTADSGGVEVFRAQGDTLVRSNLATRAGLIEHLQALETKAHPGHLLERFFADARGGAEPVLIAVPETFADHEFRQALAECEHPAFYAACVERNGTFRLQARSARGQRLLQEAHLDLDKLLEPPRRRMVPLFDTRRDPQLPIIFAAHPFPLRLTAPADATRCLRIDEHMSYSVTANGMLLQWDSPQHGGRLIAEGLPSGRIWWHDVFPHATSPRVRALIGHEGATRVWLIDFDPLTGECRQVQMQTAPCREMGILDPSGSVFVITNNARSVQIFDPQTGLLQAACTVPPEMTWKRGRYFMVHPPEEVAWRALTFDGFRLNFELVVPAEIQHRLQFTDVLDRPGSAGPVGVTLEGDIFTVDGQLLFEFLGQHPVRQWRGARLAAVSVDRTRFVFAPLDSTTKTTLYAVSLPSGEISEWNAAQNAIIGAAISAGSPRPVRSQCTEIGVDTDGHLVLKAKHAWLRIEFAPHLHKLQLRSGVDKPLHVRQFIPIPHTQYRLREARWDDGSRAVIDARGLLHLRSSDTSVPETTIVLHANDLAGWCAGVGAWGDRYFLPPGEYGLDVGWVWRDILQPFARLLR